MGSNPGRTAALNQTRARSLAASLDGLSSADKSDLKARSTNDMVGVCNATGLGAALLLEPGQRSFGSAVLWASNAGVHELTLMVDPAAGPADQARRAETLAIQTHVYEVDGSQLVPARPAPTYSAVSAPSHTDVGMAFLLDAGLDIITDHGVVIGEYLGLEVARMVPNSDGGEIQVGVGAVDREANRVLHGGTITAEVLSRVIAEVAMYRRPGGAFHPLGQMARERWMMHSLINDPSQVELREIARVESASARRGLRTDSSAAGIADADGHRVLVVTTVGVDVALIGAIADLISRDTPDRVVVVSSPPMMLPLSRSLDWLSVPVSIAEITPPWAG